MFIDSQISKFEPCQEVKETPHVILVLIAPLSDIPMFYIKYMYLTMHKVHMHAGAIR